MEYVPTNTNLLTRGQKKLALVTREPKKPLTEKIGPFRESNDVTEKGENHSEHTPLDIFERKREEKVQWRLLQCLVPWY